MLDHPGVLLSAQPPRLKSETDHGLKIARSLVELSIFQFVRFPSAALSEFLRGYHEKPAPGSTLRMRQHPFPHPAAVMLHGPL